MNWRPAPRLMHWLQAWLVLALVVTVWPELAPGWLGAGLVMVIVPGLDVLACRRQAPLRLERELARNLPIGVWQNVRLRLHNPGERPLTVTLFDHIPAHFEFEHLPAEGRIPAGGFLEFSYRLRALRRGDADFPGADLRILSPGGFWWRSRFLAAPDSVRIYPNFAAVSQYALLATDQREGTLGVLRRQRRGEGLDFHQLREYREGDALRQIDWKASSRLKKLVAREYQEERDQQVMFLLDTGRRLRAEDGAKHHFDQALNALLLLAYVALRQGDSVGLMSFAGDERFRPPGKGLTTLNGLLNATYDLEPSLQPADYQNAARQLASRLKKRALVVLMTTLRDDDAEELMPAVRLLAQKHLVLVADLREQVFDGLRQEPPAGFGEALRYLAGEELLRRRADLHERLLRSGLNLVDANPQELPIRLVNRYLDIKASGRL